MIPKFLPALALSCSVAALSGGCVHGKFVGANYIPARMYEGDERPDSQIATIGHVATV